MAFQTTTEIAPLLPAPTEFRASVELVAPVMFAPLNRHWYDNCPVPVAVTLKLTVAPAFTIWLCGGTVMVTGTPPEGPTNAKL
jgi:hypothetical protein